MTSKTHAQAGKCRAESPLFVSLRALGTRISTRFGKSHPGRRLQFVETLPLGGKRQVMLIVCDGQHFLIGTGSDAVTAITPFTVHTNAATHAPQDSPSSDRANAKLNRGRFLQ